MTAFYERPDWDTEIPDSKYHSFDPTTNYWTGFLAFIVSVILFGVLLILRNLNGASVILDSFLATSVAALIHWGLLALGTALLKHHIDAVCDAGGRMGLDAQTFYFPINMLSFIFGVALELVALVLVPFLAGHLSNTGNLIQGLIPCWTFLVAAGIFGLALSVKASMNKSKALAHPMITIAGLVVLFTAAVADIIFAVIALFGGIVDLPRTVIISVIVIASVLYLAYDINHAKK